MAAYSGMRLAPRDRTIGIVLIVLACALLIPISLTVEANRKLQAPAPHTIVSAETLRQWQQAGEVQIVDARSDAAFAASHIPGSRALPANALLDAEFTAAQPLFLLRRTADQRGVRPDRLTVVYADTKQDAVFVIWALKAMGIDDVRLLDGGFAAWLGAGLPTASGPAAALSDAGGSWPQAATPHLADAIDVYGRLGANGFTMVDTREIAFHATGHIPGSLSLPASELQFGTGEWLPATFLMQSVRKLPRDERIVLYGDDVREAAMLWWFFYSRGFENASLLGASFPLWQESGFPVNALDFIPAGGAAGGARIGGGCG